MSSDAANGAPNGAGGSGLPRSPSPVPEIPVAPVAPEPVWGGDRPITPTFEVLGVEWVADAAAPTLEFKLRVDESSGRDVFTIALNAQIHIDPARRSYDAATREALVELFGAPERWGATTHSFLWSHASSLVPSFSDSTEFSMIVPCSYDLELAAAKYFYSLPDGEVPLSFHFTGSIMHRGDDGQLQVVLVPWSCSAQWKMPVSKWREMMERHYPNGAWVRLHADTLEALRAMRAEQGLPSYDACVVELMSEREEGTSDG